MSEKITKTRHDNSDSNNDDHRMHRDVCCSGQWSFSCRPLLHVCHTWVLERRALAGCDWRLLTSRKFASLQDDGIFWNICLELDYPTLQRGDDDWGALRYPDSVRVCVMFNTDVLHERVYFRATLRAQQEAVSADATATATATPSATAASQGLATATAGGGLGLGGADGDVEGMSYADPNQRKHIGDVFLVASDRSLTVRVDIAYLANTQDARACPAAAPVRVPPCSLVDDMEALLADGRMSDVVLVAGEGGREWRAHRAVLAARSPVFAAMFEHDMAEAKSSRVVIGDVDGDVLHQVLRYLYTGRVHHIRHLGVEVLAVADRYALPRLKALCEEELAAGVRPDNALAVLVTADLLAAKELRDAALQCVCANIHQVLASDAWRELVRAQPHLLHLVMAKCVNYPVRDP